MFRYRILKNFLRYQCVFSKLSCGMWQFRPLKYWRNGQPLCWYTFMHFTPL